MYYTNTYSYMFIMGYILSCSCNLTKLNFLALEGPNGCEAMDGHCVPGKSFRRFLFVRMTVLKRWRMQCLVCELYLVFPNEAGQPLNHNNMINRFFVKGLNDAELQIIRFHDLRHTYASLLIEQGENIKYIQTQLGHSSPIVTLNVYAHLMKDTKR